MTKVSFLNKHAYSLALLQDLDVELTSDLSEDLSSEHGSDSEGFIGDEGCTRKPKLSNKKLPQNLKKKIARLLSKFKMSEEDFISYHESNNLKKCLPSIEEFILEELDNLNIDSEDSFTDDVNVEDNISIASTPKPSLKPYFSSSRSIWSSQTPPESEDEANDERQRENAVTIDFEQPFNVAYKTLNHSVSSLQTSECSTLKKFRPDVANSKLRVKCLSKEETLTHRQLQSFIGEDASCLLYVLLDHSLPYISNIYCNLIQKRFKVLPSSLSNDIKAFYGCLTLKIQKLIRSIAIGQFFAPIKIICIGGENFFYSLIPPFVEVFSQNPSHWLAYITFLLIPLEHSAFTNQIKSFDENYLTLFYDSKWKQLISSSEAKLCEGPNLVFSRIMKFLQKATRVHFLPIGEVMLNFLAGDSAVEESTRQQLFLPFLNGVKLNSCKSIKQFLSCSISSENEDAFSSTRVSSHPFLQIEYWIASNAATKEMLKFTIRASQLCIQHLSSTPASTPELSSLRITFLPKVKRQKLKVLAGKMARDITAIKYNSTTSLSSIDHVNRLVACPTNKNTFLTVSVDNVVYDKVKFFQVSSSWQTHVKFFPISVSGVCDVS